MPTTQTDSTLTINNLSAGYRIGASKFPVIHDASMEVERGRSLVLLGQNGCGKSTLLKAVFGLNLIMGGSIAVNGRELNNASLLERIRQGISYVPQGRGVFQDMTVTENLRAATVAMRHRSRAIDETLDRIPELRAVQDQKGGVLSGGQARLLSISMGLIREPEWLLIDEPTIGLSPAKVDTVFEFITSQQRERGLGVIIAEQNVVAAVKWFDRALILRSGSPSWDGPCSDLRGLSNVELAEVL